MSTAEILSLISLISYIIAGVAFVAAVFFWFFFRIPAVVGDLSGRTARKSIERMRVTPAKATGQGYRPATVNTSRGKLTETMQPSRQPAPETAKKAEPAPKKTKKAKAEEQMPETGLLGTNKAGRVNTQETALLADENATELLTDANATELLTDANATELLTDANATELLNDPDATGMLTDEDATELLVEERVPVRRAGGKRLTMLEEVMLIHTNEVIG